MKITFVCIFALAFAQLATAIPLPADDGSTSNLNAPPSPAAAAGDATVPDAAAEVAAVPAVEEHLNLPPPAVVTGTLQSMGLSTDNGESVANGDGITMDKLYAGIDLDQLVKPYGKPDDQQMEVPPVELPPIEETREGDNRNFLQIYPEINKNQEIVSNKLINTYSVQNKLVNVHNRNTVNYLKTLNVNTDYITNVQRVNHPKQQIQTITHIHNRYVPKLIVKHTRTDRLNDLPPKEVIVPPVVQELTTQLPPVIEKVEIERLDYDQAARADTGAPPAVEAAPAQEQSVSIVSAAADAEPGLALQAKQ